MSRDTNVVELPSVQTDEQREARAQWRAGYDAGLKLGAGRAFQSRWLVNISLELTLLRLIVNAQSIEIDRLGRVLACANRAKLDALGRVVVLARRLDQVAPGWDS